MEMVAYQNAFLVFMKHNRERIMEENACLYLRETSNKCGKEWAALDATDGTRKGTGTRDAITLRMKLKKKVIREYDIPDILQLFLFLIFLACVLSPQHEGVTFSRFCIDLSLFLS